MAETLGSLCDKLTIVKLKQYHTEEAQKLESLGKQALQLQREIDEYVKKTEFGNIIFAGNLVILKDNLPVDRSGFG